MEGISPRFFCRAEDAGLLREILDGTADLKPRMEFLAPLDPFLWDKPLIRALWDFDYSWEIYTPAEKRKYGYYTLPILYGERFIGRIDTAADRKNGALAVKGLWWEPGVRETKKLTRFARFNGCEIHSEERQPTDGAAVGKEQK